MQTPMLLIRRGAAPLLLSSMALLALAGCSGNKKEDAILPLAARFDVNVVNGDPAVFFAKGADPNTTDDIVVVDVMLRSTAATTFSGFTMEIQFDPTVIQVGQVDLTNTPLGDCTSGTGLHPICKDNAHSGTIPANDSGDLLIGVGSQTGGALATVSGGTVKLFSLRFVGATVGSSDVRFIQGAGNGDCEILDAATPPADLGITCDSGAAQVVVAR